MKLPNFIGPTYPAWSTNLDAERTINLYPEAVEGGTGKVPLALYGTPGLRVFTQVGDGPIRGIFAQDNKCYVVSGWFLYEVFRSGNASVIGPLGTTDADRAVGHGPVTMSSNGSAGSQLFVVASGHGYIYDWSTDTLATITDAQFPSNPLMGAFLDGYFVVLQGQSPRFQISALQDGTSWDGLDVAEVSMSSNDLRAMVISHRELWLMGSKTTEIWVDSGDPSFPLAPLSGTFIEHGISAPWSGVALDNSIFWLGQDERGARIVWRAQVYTPQRISTHAVEQTLGRIP